VVADLNKGRQKKGGSLLRLTFFGAAGEVTGSSLVVESDDARFLVDYGMLPGRPRGAPVAIAKRMHATSGGSTFIVLTHAHVDPADCCRASPAWAATARRSIALVRPRIWSTVMLKDSATCRPGRASRSQWSPPLADEAPLYTAEDVDRLTTRTDGVPYGVGSVRIRRCVCG